MRRGWVLRSLRLRTPAPTAMQPCITPLLRKSSRGSGAFARPLRSLKRLADRSNLSHQGSEADSIGWEVWKIVIVAMLGPFLSVLDATVVNVSLSSLATELHSSLSVIQWVASGYLLSLALMLPLSGWLVDRVGARKLYICCFSAFTIASALGGLARSAHSLIGFRVLQGIAGGLLAPLAQSMLARPAGGRRMGKAIGQRLLPSYSLPPLAPV